MSFGAENIWEWKATGWISLSLVIIERIAARA